MKKTIDALTGGRFFAMLLIVVSHLEFLSYYSFGQIYNDYFHNPTLGVDYFFMLSGFGMMLSSLRKPQLQDPVPLKIRNLVSYAIHHIKKIYPLYLAALGLGIVHKILFTYVIGDTALSFIEIAKIIIKAVPSLFLVQSATGIYALSHAFCGVFWFLSCLFCIYLVSPLLIRFLQKHIRKISSAVVALGIIAAFAVSLVYLFSYVEARTRFDVLVYSSPYSRVMYVAYGMVLALLTTLGKNKGSAFLEYPAILLACAYFFLRRFLPPVSFVRYSLDLLICGFSLYSLVIGKGVFVKVLSSKPVVYLGNLSMYVFIIHFLLRMYIDSTVSALGWNTPVVAVAEVALIFLLSYGISAVVAAGKAAKKPELTAEEPYKNSNHKTGELSKR